MMIPNVTHDRGVLKETVVGRVIDFTFPAELAAGVPSSLGFLPERTRQNMPRWAGKLWSPKPIRRATIAASSKSRDWPASSPREVWACTVPVRSPTAN
ncbi:hypothetical protein [Streptomyces anulatus]|uniref:hypothetical protein n=1 Tax=Streptomyces anulatus TaxID=1892 RepID=UPI003251B910